MAVGHVASLLTQNDRSDQGDSVGVLNGEWGYLNQSFPHHHLWKESILHAPLFRLLG